MQRRILGTILFTRDFHDGPQSRVRRMTAHMKFVAFVPLLALSACTSSYNRGMDQYQLAKEAMDRQDTAGMRALLLSAKWHMYDAMKQEDLNASERAAAMSVRVRSLIESGAGRWVTGEALAASQWFDPEVESNGDPVGLAVLQAHALDPERAHARLLAAIPYATTPESRLHLDWERVYALLKIGTKDAHAEALKICQLHPGKNDFDEWKAHLSSQ